MRQAAGAAHIEVAAAMGTLRDKNALWVQLISIKSSLGGGRKGGGGIQDQGIMRWGEMVSCSKLHSGCGKTDE